MCSPCILCSFEYSNVVREYVSRECDFKCCEIVCDSVYVCVAWPSIVLTAMVMVPAMMVCVSSAAARVYIHLHFEGRHCTGRLDQW